MWLRTLNRKYRIYDVAYLKGHLWYDMSLCKDQCLQNTSLIRHRGSGLLCRNVGKSRTQRQWSFVWTEVSSTFGVTFRCHQTISGLGVDSCVTPTLHLRLLRLAPKVQTIVTVSLSHGKTSSCQGPGSQSLVKFHTSSARWGHLHATVTVVPRKGLQ
jgi:hypothetical protein